MRRIYILLIIGPLAFGAIAVGIWSMGRDPTKGKVAPVRPNVILISMDTTRADHLSCYGYDKPTSPNLQKLAQRGVRYANAHSQASWTLPSHMSLFTSMLPSHCQVNHLVSVLSEGIPTLAEVMRKQDYHTAGLVNDGQINSDLGFNRGFTDWVEFHAGTPEGNCVHITDEVLHWLDAAPPEPFFLFVHYYDAHAPYDPPEEFRQRFGSRLSGRECGRIVNRGQDHQGPIRDPDLFKQVIGSYDGGIAWLDQELGRLLDRVPKNTLVVVFADHGEAFKEHGWTLHGVTLYEEEIHVPLIMSWPEVLPKGLVVEAPVMLLDVSPTILALCNLQAPAHYEGIDLAPTWGKNPLPIRPIFSETKVQLECQALKMVALRDWKLIRSIVDGREELYHLPDEQKNLVDKETPMHEALSALAKRWIAEEDFWMIHAQGPGEFTVKLVPRTGQFLKIIPFGQNLEKDFYATDPNGRWFEWKCRPGAHTKGIFLQIAPSEAGIRFDLSIDGRAEPSKVFTGIQQASPTTMPFDLVLDGGGLSDPVIYKPFVGDKPGFYVFRHRGKAATFPSLAGTLDDRAINQLRLLGYLQ